MKLHAAGGIPHEPDAAPREMRLPGRLDDERVHGRAVCAGTAHDDTVPTVEQRCDSDRGPLRRRARRRAPAAGRRRRFTGTAASASASTAATPTRTLTTGPSPAPPAGPAAHRSAPPREPARASAAPAARPPPQPLRLRGRVPLNRAASCSCRSIWRTGAPGRADRPRPLRRPEPPDFVLGMAEG